MAKTVRKSKQAAAKAAQRWKAARPLNVDNYGVDIIDALNNQIQFAHGIDLAIMGEGRLSGFDSSPLSQLVETHIEGLRFIADSFEELRHSTKPASEGGAA
jgi:hypothetical protein